MKKDEFIELFREAIKLYNANHDVDVVVVFVEHNTDIAHVMGRVCSYHGTIAVRSLITSLINHIKPDVPQQLLDEMWTEILEQVPPKPNEKGN